MLFERHTVRLSLGRDRLRAEKRRKTRRRDAFGKTTSDRIGICANGRRRGSLLNNVFAWRLKKPRRPRVPRISFTRESIGPPPRQPPVSTTLSDRSDRDENAIRSAVATNTNACALLNATPA